MDEIQQVAEIGATVEVPPMEEEQLVVEPRPGKQKGPSNNLHKQENLVGWIYVAPMLIGLLVFTAIPIIMSLISMFYDWNGTDSLLEAEGVGFGNFADIFGGLHSQQYWESFGNTLLYALQLPIGLILGMFLALAMNREMRGVQVFRIIYYIPCVMSVVAVTIVWQKLFAYGGIIDTALGTTGQFLWLDSKVGVVITVILLQVWKGVGYTTLMFIAGLQSVSTDQLEAARIDGANSWTILRKITLPALYPIIFYLLVTGLIGSLQMFNESYVLTGDGYKTAVGEVYYFGQTLGRYGEASVAAWVLAFIIFIVTAIQMYVDKRKREAE